MRYRLLRCWLVLLPLFVLGVNAATAQQAATIRGKISDQDGAPVAGATVFMPQLRLGSLTDENGYYTINQVPAGDHAFLVFMDEMDTISQQVTVTAGQVLALNLVMKPQITTEAVIIQGDQGPRIEQREPAPGLTTVTSEQIKIIPSFGTADLSQYLQVLPGVVFTGDQGGQLYVRGGTPIQNMVMMDGAIVYNPFHTLGLFSVFDPDYIRRADVYSGGYSAEYGGRVSSVMDIQTRHGNFRRVSGKVEATPIISTAMVEGPIGRPSATTGLAPVSYLASVRHAYLDQTSPTLYPHVNDSVGLPFNFTDIFAKMTFGSAANQFSLFGFHQRDRVSYGYPTDLEWASSGGGLNFMVLPGNTRMIMSGGLGISQFRNEQLNPDEAFPRNSSIGGFNGRLNFAFMIGQADELSYGLQFLGFSSALKFTNSLGLITETEDNNTEFAAYFKYKKVFRKAILDPSGSVNFFTRAVIEPSVRLHYYSKHNVVIEPRLRAKLNFKNVSLQAAWGIYNQNLMAALSDRDIVQLFQGYIAAPRQGMDNRPLPDSYLQRATHYLAGIEVQPVRGVKITAEGWLKNFQQVTNINRNRLFPEEDKFVAESGRAYGADLIVAYDRNHLYLYGTYGYAINTRNDGIQEYSPIWDRRHNANIVANYRIGELRGKTTGQLRDYRWEFGIRWNLGSGFPFTQTQGFYANQNFNVDGSQTDYVSQNGSLGILLSNDYNGGRLPDYHRLDVMFKRRFLFGDRSLLEINLTAINTYNRQNIFYYDRVRNARVDQLPIVPTAGISFRF